MALREVFAFLGFEFDKSKLDQADTAVEGLIGKVQDLVGVFVGGKIVQGLNSIAAELGAFDDLSTRTGIAVQDLQALSLTFQTNGSSASEMNAALTRLQSSLGGLSDGLPAQAEAFAKLGIATRDASGAAPTLAQALPQIFENFGRLTSEAEKARVATTLFGRTGINLLPVLSRGAEGFAEVREQLELIGGGASADATRAASNYNNALARLHYSFFSLKGMIASAVLPRLEAVVETASKAIGRFAAWAKQTAIIDTAAIALAGTLALTLGRALAPYLVSGLKFGAIFLAVEDVIGFLQGKDSLVGRLIERAFGEGAATAVRTWVDDAIYELGRFIESSDYAMHAWEDANRSWWERAVALFSLGFRDLMKGGPALLASVVQLWEEINASFQRMILGLVTTWNDFASGLSLPDAITSAIKIDDSGVKKRIAEREDAANLAAWKQFSETKPEEFAALRAKGEAPDVTHALDSATQALEYALGRGTGRSGILLGGVPASPEPVSPANVLAAAHGRPEVRIEQGPVRSGTEQPFSMVQNNSITVQVPAGTPASQAREIARQAANGVRDANRAAKQALTQRGSK